MGGARLVARVPHTRLVPKGHDLVRMLVRVLRCDVRHNILQERVRNAAFGEETDCGTPPPSVNLIPAIPRRNRSRRAQ